MLHECPKWSGIRRPYQAFCAKVLTGGRHRSGATVNALQAATDTHCFKTTGLLAEDPTLVLHAELRGLGLEAGGEETFRIEKAP